MAKRKRYAEGAPIDWQYSDNGAKPEDKRFTTAEAAAQIGVDKPTLFRWWQLLKFPDVPEAPDYYMPDLRYRGDQMTLHWPQIVIDRIKTLLAAEGGPGRARLPPKPGSPSIPGGASARYRHKRELAAAIAEKAELLGLD